MLGMQTAALLVNDKFLLQFLLLENPHELDSQIALNTSAAVSLCCLLVDKIVGH